MAASVLWWPVPWLCHVPVWSLSKTGQPAPLVRAWPVSIFPYVTLSVHLVADESPAFQS